MAEELHNEIESVTGGAREHYREIYCRNCGASIIRIYPTDDRPIDFPNRPCSRCGSRDFGSRSVN